MIKYTDFHKPNSTAIHAIYYDSESESMFVVYSRGLAYRYDSVNYGSFEAISLAGSAGKAVNAFKMSRSHPGGVYLGYLFDDDFESREEDDNVHTSCLSLDENTTMEDLNNVTNIFVNKNNAIKPDDGLREGNLVYLASKNLTMSASKSNYEVEFKTEITGDRIFTHFTEATGIEDAISKLSIISDALQVTLTILSVKVNYERN